MIRVLVTGGSGYIGGRLVQALAADPNVSVIVARRAQARPAGDSSITIDWSDRASIEAACRDHHAVIHLAAMNEPDCERDPARALEVNGLATLSLLHASASAGVQRLVYLSTIKVHGGNPGGTLTELSVPRPTSHYGITHRLAEDYVLAAGGRSGLQGIVLRLSNALGPPVHRSVNAWTLIANDLCRQAASTQSIVLKSSGLAWRNFVGMADVVEAIRHALTMPRDRLGDGLFHLGGAKSIKILELAQLVARRAELLFGDRIKLERATPAAGEQHPALDWRIDKLIATGWKPRQPLETEIDGTLRLCRESSAVSSA